MVRRPVNALSVDRVLQEGGGEEGAVSVDWEGRLEQWAEELALLRAVEDVAWVPLATAEAEAGVSRSTLRAWYRAGHLPSRLVDSPNGPQRLVPLHAVVERAAASPRLRRRSEQAVGLEAGLALLQRRVDELEARLAALEARAPGSATAQEGGGPT
jgi:hypothetical protein